MIEVIVNRNPIKDNSFSIRDYDFGYKKEYIYNNTLYLIEDHPQMEKIGRQLLDKSDIMTLKGTFVGRGIYVPEAIPVMEDGFDYIVTLKPFYEWVESRLAAQSIRQKILCDNGFDMINYVDDFRHICNINKIVKEVYEKSRSFPSYPETVTKENNETICLSEAELTYFKNKRTLNELRRYIDRSGAATEKNFKDYLNLTRSQLAWFKTYLDIRFPKEYISTQERYELCMRSYPECFMWHPSAYNWSDEIIDANSREEE